MTCIFHFHAFVSCLFSLLENNVNQVFFIIWCHICSMQLHLVEFTAWPSINVCVYLIKATYHCLSEDFSWENNSVTTSWLLENWTVWLHLCSHMCSCLSALCHLFCREKSLPYTSVIAMWHLVPYFTIPEIVSVLEVGLWQLGAVGTRCHRVTLVWCAGLLCPPQGRLSAGFTNAQAASQIF